MIVVATVAVVAATTTASWSCVALASLELSGGSALAGDEVRFTGSFYNDTKPVLIRWDGLDGPVLAVVAPQEFTDFNHDFRRAVVGAFTVPSDARAGSHLVLATQEDAAGAPTWGVPARAVLEVMGDGASSANRGEKRLTSHRRVLVTRDVSPSLAKPAVVGLAAAGLVILLGWLRLRRQAARGRQTETVDT